MSALEFLFGALIGAFVVVGVAGVIWRLIRRRHTVTPVELPRLPPLEVGEYTERHRVFTAYTLARAKNCILAEAPPYIGLDDLASFLDVSHSSRSMKGAKEELYRLYPSDIADTVEKLLTGDVWSDQVDAAAGGRRY